MSILSIAVVFHFNNFWCFFDKLFSASGASAVAIDNKIEQAMVSTFPLFIFFCQLNLVNLTGCKKKLAIILYNSKDHKLHNESQLHLNNIFVVVC